MTRPASPASSSSGHSAYHSAPSSRAPSPDVDKLIEDAEALKIEGNDYFRQGKWNESLVAYRSALGRLPARHSKGKEREDETESSPLDKTAQLRAVINGNIAACHMKLGEYKEAVEASTQALLDDPLYIKALQRRATANDRIGSWSSLSSAQDDYNKLLEVIIPSSSTQAQIDEIKRAQFRLKPRLEAAQKAEMGEMMEKLKGLGNSILGTASPHSWSLIKLGGRSGNFGLSTDNFKFEPNGQGGYSVNFTR